MKARLVSGVGASLLLAIACSGGAFTASPDDGASGAGGNGVGVAGAVGAGGKKADGGQSSLAGGSSTTGGSVTPAGGSATAGTGVVSSAGASNEGGEPPTSGCQSTTDCKPTNQCREATCVTGVCGEKNLPNGPYSLQVPGDCQQARCEEGKETLAIDLADADDKSECTTDSCEATGKPLHVARLGQTCGNGGGICSHVGKCELCDRNLCPAATECMLPVCSNNQCQLTPRPVGTLCAQQTNQCDSSGSCVDCTDNGGCTEAEVCQTNKCVPA